MEKFTYYLFDFDGTLFDTLKANERVFIEAFRYIGIEIKKEDVLHYTRVPIPETFKKLGAPKEKWDIFGEHILALVNDQTTIDMTNIYDDTYDTLLDLRLSEASLSIVTSNNVRHVKDILKKYAMGDLFFDVLVGNQEAPIPKPNPQPLNVALEMLHYSGDRKDVAYIGDAMNDVLAAKAAGVQPILLDRHNEFKDSEEYIRIRSLKELLD